MEKKFGKLPVFHIPEYFPEDQRREILQYKLNSILDIKDLGKSLQALVPHSNVPKNWFAKFVVKNLKLTFPQLVERYLAYFELMYENFIHPLAELSDFSSLYSYNQHICYVKDLLEQDEDTKPLVLFLSNLEGTLRNALVHRNYYVKDKILHYYQPYPKKKQVRFEKKSLEEFEKEVGMMFFQQWIFNIISGIRLSGMSLEKVQSLQNNPIIRRIDQTDDDPK